MTRRRFELRWDDAAMYWYLLERVGTNEYPVQDFGRCPKHEAESRARHVVRNQAPSQLLIFTKKGRIGRGNRSEATYTLDPVRSRG